MNRCQGKLLFGASGVSDLLQRVGGVHIRQFQRIGFQQKEILFVTTDDGAAAPVAGQFQ